MRNEPREIRPGSQRTHWEPMRPDKGGRRHGRRRGVRCYETEQKIILGITSVLVFTASIGCRKKVPITAAPPAPPPAAIEAPKPNPPVIADFAVEPGRIEL